MKLLVNLKKCQTQEQTQVRCSYPGHPDNQGIDRLLEQIRFALVCRHCEAAPCVQACPRGALEKNGDRLLQRANMLCTGCGTCSLACPFGTILPELILFPSSVCDLCHDRLDAEEKPLCVQTCSDEGLEYKRNIPKDLTFVELWPGLIVHLENNCTWKPILKADTDHA
jgi:Fe-S-cluster-containing dehydrogenase component